MGQSLGPTLLATTLTSGERSDATEPDTLRRGAGISRYLLIERVGAGGMGVVWAAYDPELDRKVAIKLLRARGDADESAEARARLLREAQVMARLSHPNVIFVHDVGVHHGQVFVAMEFVEGGTLGAWLSDKPRDLRAILAVFVQAGRGLAAAHAAGLVHRDFKPDNVLVGRDGRVRVTDFGLARSLESDADARGALVRETRETEETEETESSEGSGAGLGQTTLTRTGALLGTPAFMAPEQFDTGRVDARSDQFSFCVALWTALYDQRPFAGDSLLELAGAVMSGRVRPPPSDSRVPGFIQAALRRGLAPDPGARWPTLDELLAELERDPTIARRRWLVGGGLGATLAALLVLPGMLEQQVEPELCPAADARLEGVWDAERRETLRASLARSGHDSLAPQVVEGLDRYAGDWLAMHRDACEDTHVRHELSATVLDERMRCLEDRRVALAAATEQLADADAERSISPLNLIGRLPSIERCSGASELAGQLPLPADPTLAREVEQLRSELAVERARVDLYGGRDVVPALEQLLVRAEALDYPPLSAQVLVELGFAEASQGDPPQVRARLEQAIVAAVRTGQDELAARAGVELVYVVGWLLDEPNTARQWAELVDAWHARTRAPALPRAQLLVSRATVLLNLGEDPTPVLFDALALLGVDESLAGLDTLAPGHVTTATWAVNMLAVGAAERGHHVRARDLFRRVHALHVRSRGPEDSLTRVAAFGWARSAFLAGDWQEAGQVTRDAMGSFEDAPAAAPQMGERVLAWEIERAHATAELRGELPCDAAIGAKLSELDALAIRPESRVVVARGRRLCGDLEGADAVMRGLEIPEHTIVRPMLLRERAQLRLAQGRLDDAEADLRATLDSLLALGIREQLPVAQTLGNFAALAEARGDTREAIAKLHEALAIDDALMPAGHPASVPRLEALARLEPELAERHRARAAAIRERVGDALLSPARPGDARPAP